MVHNSKELVESILTGDMVSAKRLFESRLESIKENKLYEEKRRLAALNESQYSAATQSKLASGKYRLLSPSEREGRYVSDDPDTPSNKPTKRTRVKKLAAPGTVVPRSLSIGDRYEKALAQAKDLEARGSTGKVAAVKKVYRPYRAAKAVTGGVKKAWGLWGDVMSSAARGALEEEKARKIRPLISIKKPIRIIKKDK